MATVQTQVVGGAIQQKTANTVAELKTLLGVAANYTAKVNQEPATDDQDLEDFDIVIFAPSVKGAKAGKHYSYQFRHGNVITRKLSLA